MLAIVMSILCPSVVNMLFWSKSLWSLNGGVNKRCIDIIIKNYYMDKESQKGKQEWVGACKLFCIYLPSEAKNICEDLDLPPKSFFWKRP